MTGVQVAKGIGKVAEVAAIGTVVAGLFTVKMMGFGLLGAGKVLTGQVKFTKKGGK